MRLIDRNRATAQTFLPQLVAQRDALRALSAELGAVLAAHLSAGGSLHDVRARDLIETGVHLDVASARLEEARAHLVHAPQDEEA